MASIKQPLLLSLPLLLLLLLSTESTALECSFSEKAKSLGDFNCPTDVNNKPWNKDDVQYAAWKWAPIVYHHPLEKYYLTDPEQWLSRSRLFDRFYNPVSARETVPNTEELYWSFATGLNSSHTEEQIKGDAFDEDGKSKARVWFNVLQHEQSGGWIINYNLFYGRQGVRDWERVSILICPGSAQITAALFSQHHHHLLRNCSAGECEFESSEEDNTQHLVTYSALHSHANYPHSNPNTAIFGQIRTFHGDSDGLYLVDRLGKDTRHRFIPTLKNIARLPDEAQVRIQMEEKHCSRWGRSLVQGQIPARTAASTRGLQAEEKEDSWTDRDHWALYPGWWGARQEDTPQPPVIVCIMENQTLEGKCPDSDPYRILRRVLGPLALWDKKSLTRRSKYYVAPSSLDSSSFFEEDAGEDGEDDAEGDGGGGARSGGGEEEKVVLLEKLPVPWLIDFEQLAAGSTVPEGYATGRGPLYSPAPDPLPLLPAPPLTPSLCS
eukprot:gene23115-30317_t